MLIGTFCIEVDGEIFTENVQKMTRTLKKTEGDVIDEDIHVSSGFI